MFLIIVHNSKTKTGLAVKLRFILTQHARDEELFKNFENYFSCGIFEKTKRGEVNFKVYKFFFFMKKSYPFIINIQSLA